MPWMGELLPNADGTTAWVPFLEEFRLAKMTVCWWSLMAPLWRDTNWSVYRIKRITTWISMAQYRCRWIRFSLVRRLLRRNVEWDGFLISQILSSSFAQCWKGVLWDQLGQSELLRICILKEPSCIFALSLSISETCEGTGLSFKASLWTVMGLSRKKALM